MYNKKMNRFNHLASTVFLGITIIVSGCQKQAEVTREQIEFIMSKEQIPTKRTRKEETRKHYFVLQNFIENVLRDL